MRKIYIILYKDGTLNFTLIKPSVEAHGKGSRFFETYYSNTISTISDWIANNYQSDFIRELFL